MPPFISFSPRHLRKLYEIFQDNRLCITCLAKKTPTVKAFAAGEVEALSKQDFRRLCRELQDINASIEGFIKQGKQQQLQQLLKDKRLHKHKIFNSQHSDILEKVRLEVPLKLLEIRTAQQLFASLRVRLLLV